MKLSTRELATLAAFGALWGLVEISLGSLLKTLNIPLSGLVLAAVGLAIALAGRAFVPKRGTLLFIGVIATLLKLFSLGGVILGPMVGIISEALVAELVLLLPARPGRPAFALAGALGSAWVLLQPFVTGPLLFGRTVFTAWLDLLDRGSRLLGIPQTLAIWIVLALLALHLAVGGAAGWASCDIARGLKLRLGRPLSNPIKT